MANTLKFGAGQWATKEGSTLAYNDENDNYKPLPFTFTRASNATVVNKAGLIETVGNGIPRIDFTDSADGVLLLEPSRTNIALESNQFNESEWSKTNTSVSANQTGVGGSTDAWLLSKSSSDALIRQFITTTGANTFSVYVKKGSLSWVRLFIASSTQSSSIYINLDNGSTGTSTGSPTVKVVTMDNGWYRCIITKNTTNINNFRIYPANADNDTSGTTGNIYIQNSQVEVGSYSTSYIPTNGSTVTRLADTASGAGNSEVFNDSSGVLFFNSSRLNSNQIGSIILSVTDGSISNGVSLYYGNSGVICDIFNSSGTRTLSSSMSLQNQALFNKFLVKYKTNDIALWVNGFEVAVNTEAISISGLNEMEFNYGNNSFPFYGKTKQIGYYDAILTDSELEYLTSYRSLSELVTELNLNTL